MSNEPQIEDVDEVPLLAAPRHPLPEVITTPEELARAVGELARGSGDIALDAERASGFKYSQRAYLIQIYRRGGGLHLIDPIAFGSDPEIFAPLNTVIQSAQVVLHASSQDLPCLREIGIAPTDLFDTELAGRIAGFPRIGLSALTEALLQIRLAKEHSAVDWSQRPLHHDWLLYAALDVDVLLDLKDEMVRKLIERKKLEWVIEESTAALHAPPPPPRKDPWRRTSGIHQVKRPDQLAIVRELWRARDELARKRDIAAGRILNDQALIKVAMKPPTTLIHLQSIAALKKDADQWWRALESARANPTVPKAPPHDGPPTQIRLWRERAPLAYARLTHARSALTTRAGELDLPAENLLAPDLIRRFCWQDPPLGGRSESEVAEFLREGGARPWQVAVAAPFLLAIEGVSEPLIMEYPDEGVSELS
jgi:ribonuclease D